MQLLKAIRFVNSVCMIFSLWKQASQLSVYENKDLVQICLQNEWSLVPFFVTW